ncbi:MAG: aldehyde reductase [Bacteroidales bacterium]|nr:aldehyde reductase [Bacteroidales bacterium]
MTILDKTKPVLVTGATGYIAGWLVKKLLEEGYTVHAAIRNPSKKEKIAHLEQIAKKEKGEIKFFQSDLMKNGSYAKAMEGCEVVFHTASPFKLEVKDPQKDLVDPAVMGTKNVLEQANKTESVKRVVVTSSCAAIYCDCTDLENTKEGVFTENDWNTTASLRYQPYSYSKTLAEKEAWKMSQQQSRWELVVVNPSMVLGPALNIHETTSESISLFKQMGDGTLKAGVPNLGMGVVDVRDLAEVHFNAGFNPEAGGRNIASGHNSSMLEMAQILHEVYADEYKIPNKPMPKWLLMLVGPMVNKTLTKQYIRNNVNKVWKADNGKSVRVLGAKYRPLKDTLVDSFRQMIDEKLV